MTLYFSNINKGFYDTDVGYTTLPSDRVVISIPDYNALFTGQAAGQIITFGTGTAQPILVTPTPPTLAPVTQITPLEFKARFTTSEWGGILAAAISDPTVLGWVFTASAATYVDLTNSDTSLGLSYLSTRTPSLLNATRIPTLLAYS